MGQVGRGHDRAVVLTCFGKVSWDMFWRDLWEGDKGSGNDLDRDPGDVWVGSREDEELLG